MPLESKNNSLEQQSRLNRIREHLGLHTSIHSPAFEGRVAAACRDQVDSLLAGARPASGEEVLDRVAGQLQVHFEEVYDDQDIEALETKYLREKREIGFGQLSMQFDDPTVDALLFERQSATSDAPDKWVAVLNLRETVSRGYWSRAHELIHRIAEPPQFNLPFYRHRNDKVNPLESLVDNVAADLAFYRRLFGPIVESLRDRPLTWDLIDLIRSLHAPSCSRLATVHATLRYWPRPAYLLRARLAGRKGRPNVDRALRIEVQGFSPDAKESLFFFPNMRVPSSSPIQHCYQTGEAISAIEQLGKWDTSGGSKLPDARALTSAFHYQDWVLGLISLV